MSVRLSKVPFSAIICTRCGERVFSTPRNTWICNTCGIKFRPLDAEVLPASSDLLEQATRLAPSALGHTQREQNTCRSNKKFEEYLERIAVAKWFRTWYNGNSSSPFKRAYKADLLTSVQVFFIAAHGGRILDAETPRLLLLNTLECEEADMHLPDTELDLV